MTTTAWMTTTVQNQPWLLPKPAWSSYNALLQLDQLLKGFDPISLGAMEDVALLDRMDTKYVMSNGQLLSALSHMQSDYWMLEVNGHRLNHYRTLYFDTPNFDLYQAHVNERPERYKVRSREYADSHLSYLEVKHRTRKGRTVKDRILTPQPALQLTSNMETWLQDVSPLNGGELEPRLWNTFTRITLVSKTCCERVTLDFDLSLSNEAKLIRLDGIAVAEVKTDRARGDSRFMAQMRSQRIRPQGFSKYAIGVALLYEGVKKNVLKSKVLWIEKTMKGLVSYE